MVKIPRFFGIVVKRGVSSVCDERLASFRETLDEDLKSDRRLFDEDAGLISFCAGMAMDAVSIEIGHLKAEGLVEDVDFCVTSKLGSTVGRLPSWLEQVEDGCVTIRA